MRKRTVIVGLIMLVIGIAFVAGGVASLRGTTSTISTFTQPQTGEYVSSEVVPEFHCRCGRKTVFLDRRTRPGTGAERREFDEPCDIRPSC